MCEDDLDEVIKIEEDSFTDAWFKELFAMELEHDAYVASIDSQIIGYICAWQVVDECTITNIAVRSDYRRQGIALYMFNALQEIMALRDVRFYYLEVRASNETAQKLYDKLGFQKVGIRKAYYSNPIEDAIVMALNFVNQLGSG